MEASEYTVTISIANQHGEVVERQFTVPVQLRAWSLLKRDDTCMLLQQFYNYFVKVRAKVGWMQQV